MTLVPGASRTSSGAKPEASTVTGTARDCASFTAWGGAAEPAIPFGVTVDPGFAPLLVALLHADALSVARITATAMLHLLVRPICSSPPILLPELSRISLPILPTPRRQTRPAPTLPPRR